MRALLISSITFWSSLVFGVSVEYNQHDLGIHEKQVVERSLQTRCVEEGRVSDSEILTVLSVTRTERIEQTIIQVAMQSTQTGIEVTVEVMVDPFTVPTHYLFGIQSNPENLCRW